MQDTRAETNPLYNSNRLKLGIFGTNVSNGCAISTAPEAFATSWPGTLAIARAADATPADGDAPTSAKFVAGLSLLLWFSVILFGRYIMYNDTLLYVLGL